MKGSISLCPTFNKYYMETSFKRNGNTLNLKALLILLNTLSLTFLLSGTSIAIPAFARKYNTSCVTCHDIYPKLNPFGEAFRMNGYRYPKDDEEKVKEEPIVMGSDSYKKVWPKSVWPNVIPKTVPISLRARTSYEIITADNSTTGQFNMPALQLIGAGTIGDHISVFAGAHLFENGKVGSIDRLFVKFNNILTKFLPVHLLNVQVGQFIPEMVTFATFHRGITNSAYAFNTYDPTMGRNFVSGHVHGAGPFGIEAFQLGIEVNGIAKSRLRYVLGMANGNGAMDDLNAQKDFYGRLCYKFGGMAYDGSIKSGNVADLETSIAIGVFGYNGTGTTNGENYSFFRAGGDVNIYLKKFNIIGGYILGSNGMEQQQKYDLYYGEVDYKIYPWLTALLRYEQANPKTLSPVRQIVPHISALAVANLKFQLETRLDLDYFQFNNLFFGLDFAF